MTGLLFYSVVAAGLGGLLPLSLRSGLGTYGIRFSLGYAIMAVLAYVSHVLLSFPLKTIVVGLVLLALAGFITLVYRAKGSIDWWEFLFHPALLLILTGTVVVAFNGGIDYLPYSDDEFSHWLRTPRLIHLSGSWAEVLHILHHPYYPPGWNMTLLLPWQLLGNVDLGQSAAAPFVLHISVIALIYDVISHFLKTRTEMAPTLVKYVAWAFILLFIAAEGMGRLWSYTLLIEQPQIYTYVTVVLLIFVAEATGQDRKLLFGVAGLTLASAYLYKVAAIAFVPAVFVLAGLVYLQRARISSGYGKEVLLVVILLTGPVLVAAGSWTVATEAKACSPLTLSPDQLAAAMKLDWLDLGGRFGAAIWTYVGSYKLPVTLAAILGVVGTVFYGRYQAILVMLVFSMIYFIALYASHLFCLNQYYFENLNSIERFTRVPMQVFHAVGLIMLFEAVLKFCKTHKILIAPGRILQRLKQPWVSVGMAFLIMILGGWQVRQIYHSIVDTSSRVYQNIDPRIEEMKRATKLIDGLLGVTLPQTPTLAVICQGCDNVVIRYARFFALGYKNTGMKPLFRVLSQTSWALRPANVWQSKASIDDVVVQLSKADIIWPIKTDAWLLAALNRLINDKSCLSSLPNKAFVREVTDGGSVQFRCIEKDNPSPDKVLSD